MRPWAAFARAYVVPGIGTGSAVNACTICLKSCTLATNAGPPSEPTMVRAMTSSARSLRSSVRVASPAADHFPR